LINRFERKFETMHGLETDYVRILYYDLSRNYSGVYQSYNYFRFCTILSGKKTVSIGSDPEFTYSTDNYLLLPPQTRVQMTIDTHTTALVFELNDTLIEKVRRKTQFMNNLSEGINLQGNYFLGDTESDISKDITAIASASNPEGVDMLDDNSRFLIDLYAQRLVYNMMKNRVSRTLLNGKHTHPISQAVRYINGNIYEPINLERLSADLGMSKSNFTHTFKKLIGITPMEYIKDKKMETALEELKEGSVTEVAFELGYSNISYFIRLFREKYHMTPKQYQLAMLNRQMASTETNAS